MLIMYIVCFYAGTIKSCTLRGSDREVILERPVYSVTATLRGVWPSSRADLYSALCSVLRLNSPNQSSVLFCFIFPIKNFLFTVKS